MALFANNVRTRHVPLWVEVQNMSTFGKMVKNTRNQCICQLTKYEWVISHLFIQKKYLVKRRQNDFYFYFQYISLLMDWIETQINDENIFPVTTDVPFPKTFQVHEFPIQFWSS